MQAVERFHLAAMERSKQKERPRTAVKSQRKRRSGSHAVELGFPRQSTLYIPLLEELLKRGGSSRPRDFHDGMTIYEALAKRFRVSKKAQVVTVRSGKYSRVWDNLIQWTKWALTREGYIDGSERGVWKLTAAGRRAARSGSLAK